VEIEEGEFIPNLPMINSDSILGPGKEPARESCDFAAKGGHPGTNTSTPSSCAHRNEPEKKNEPKHLSKRATKPHGVKGGTCCSLVVLCRLYQVFQHLLVWHSRSMFLSLLACQQNIVSFAQTIMVCPFFFANEMS
jgi:hypothetical protein